MKKVYDLSVNNQTADKRRVIKSNSGKEYDVSFVPALLNRRYYVTWIEYQSKIMTGLTEFLEIRKKISDGINVTSEEIEKTSEFTALSKEAAAAGTDLIIYAMKANGYNDFDEDELYSNFSEVGISNAINFIMGIEDENKKKIRNKKKN